MAVIYQPPSFYQFQQEKGFKILRPDISNPPLIIIAIVEGVQNIMAVIIETPPLFPIGKGVQNIMVMIH